MKKSELIRELSKFEDDLDVVIVHNTPVDFTAEQALKLLDETVLEIDEVALDTIGAPTDPPMIILWFGDSE